MKRNKNFLEFIPEVNEKIEFYEKNDLVYLKKKHNHIFDKIAQKMFFTPKESNIKLESYGSDVFRMIDGKANIIEIGNKLKEQYGDEVEPLYERLSQFIQILYNNDIVKLKKKSE